MSHQSEAELVRRSLYGDQDAFTELVRQYSNAVYGAAYSAVNDFHLAQDIAQEAFVKAWRNLGQLQDGERFGGWVIRIASNLCKDYFRKKQLIVRSLEEAANTADTVSLDEQVERNSDGQAVWKALHGLEEIYRTSTLMYYIGGYNSREISELLDVPLRTTESRLRRAKTMLKKELIELVEDTAQEKKLTESFVEKVRARITGASVTFLVENVDASVAFYEGIGFNTENIGGHIHVSHGGATFILHPAKRKADIHPNSAADGGIYFDVFCYTDSEGLRHLYAVSQEKGVEVVNGPHWSEGWSEFTIRDLDGYQVAFGG
ncbi:sigma-70 family RNA polymerase sigma factor [Paenibacillus sp. PR3]|uniref:Sigma-70 family RNA polymerase sigma factor n=1 Tax=Paenibacillus terricola TaxID=2763503 RepID=A0ABR8N246_9BACL|nr:sigma-70 family RNA polymerase sigma factor [Paenibacillus terricola]MBD3921940.1 sigma-70 family RNA polymerase sigma factor [Paenibacillus terricola]